MRPYPKSLKFVHLYADKYAHFEGKRTKFGLRRIIFPDGFIPEDGKIYDCAVTETTTGTFVYNHETFQVCRARLANTFDFAAIQQRIEEISHPKETEMQRALKKAGL